MKVYQYGVKILGWIVNHKVVQVGTKTSSIVTEDKEAAAAKSQPIQLPKLGRNCPTVSDSKEAELTVTCSSL